MERKDDGLTAYYANMMQLLVLLVDSNRMVIEAGRGTGKTKGVTGPRTIRVAASMPGETAGFGHSTYIRLMSIIIPELISFYKSAADATGRPLMREGIDFVYGEKDLPRHFCKPRYPILHPEHSIVFANGFNIRLVSTDQPDSIAGANIVHFFFEEMKHFFSVYKALEGKETVVDDIGNREKAIEVVRRSIDSYIDHFCK